LARSKAQRHLRFAQAGMAGCGGAFLSAVSPAEKGRVMPVNNVLRDENGEILMRRETARIAEICDECSDPIEPGDTMVTRNEMIPGMGRVVYVKRNYCSPCGVLLEDSLITTEAI
jgi:hypothetical protein